MALSPRERTALEDTVAELKAVRRRCNVLVQRVARLLDEQGSDGNDGQIEGDHTDERREQD